MNRALLFTLLIGLVFSRCKTYNSESIIKSEKLASSEYNSYLLSLEGKTLYALESGKRTDDNTDYIQSVLNSPIDVLIITAEASPWMTGPLSLNRDDLVIVFEPEAKLSARKGLFQGRGDSLLTISTHKNITLKGFGGSEGLSMRKRDYQRAPYERGEWRHCLNLRSTENILVEGLTIAESGGDGIYLGKVNKNEGLSYCLNTTIRNCRILNNYRQGISVISAENFLLEDSLCWGTKGTLPKAGIDFEPNSSTERFVNCRIINCRFEKNRGPGIHIYLKKLNDKSIPVDITLIGNYCRKNLLGIAINLTQLQNNPPGQLTLKDNDFGFSLFNKLPRNRSIEIIEE
jgi:hypothetical protein